MTIEDPVLPLTEWLFGGSENFGALWTLALILPLLALVILFVAYLSFAAQYGPVAGFRRVGNMLRVAARDLFSLSPRRIMAMSWLAFQEAIRMRVLVAFAVFVFVMLFASWYLDVRTDKPAQLYMGVVLGWTNLLVLILALFLSTFSLPNDIKNRTIYTVVTKPVRAGEVILGRMIGFALIGTLILIVMCVLSYVFVWRGLSHEHRLEADNAGVPLLTPDPTIKDEDGNTGWTGRTTEVDYHRHTVYINPDGTGFTDMQKGHRHRINNRNGLAMPIADLMKRARHLRTAETQNPAEADAEARAEFFADLSEQSAGLARQSESNSEGETDEKQALYLDLAAALENVQAAAEREDLQQAIEELGAAQSIVNDVAIAKFKVGPPLGQLQARMPQYGELTFLDRAGLPTDKGVNVGNEWTYRSYIEGGTLAAAIWTFESITPQRFPPSNPEFEKGIPLDLTLRVFRTHKGDIETGILGRLEVVEALSEEEIARGKQPLVSDPIIFYAQEFTADRKYIPRTLDARRGSGPVQENLNLFEDFAHDGKLIVRIRCEDRAQYFGVAKPDVYVWTGNNYFFVNFAKGYCTIWFQMVLVIAFGVLFSTFLSGPVAMLATVMSYISGYFAQFITDVRTGELEGGGPLESLIRIVEQKNLVTELDQGASTTVVYGMDNFMLGVMWLFSYLMPDYSKLQTSSYVAEGYNIPPDLMSQHLLITLVYFVVLSVLGYLVFKSREVAA